MHLLLNFLILHPYILRTLSLWSGQVWEVERLESISKGEIGTRKTSSLRGAPSVKKRNHVFPSAPPTGQRGLLLPGSGEGQPHRNSDEVLGDCCKWRRMIHFLVTYMIGNRAGSSSQCHSSEDSGTLAVWLGTPAA